MAIQTTRWSPDTCTCVVEYQWDDAVSQNSRTHAMSKAVAKCTAHTAITDLTAHFTTLMDENPRKNKFFERLRSTVSTLTTTDTQGNVVLKDGAVTWLYDANRVLQVSAPAMTTAQKTAAQSWADTNLGVGKVKVN